MQQDSPNNQVIYDENWELWRDMKVYGPASSWLRYLIKKIITNNIKKNSIQSVLDVGCGEGNITKLLSSYFTNAKVIGIDFSVKGIECANRYYAAQNLSFIHDVQSEQLNQEYNLVTAFEVLEHVEDWKSFLRRMAKASNNYMLISFPTGIMRPFEVNVGHYRNFKKGEVEEFLATENFKPVEIFYGGFPFYSPLYRDFCNMTNSGNNSFTKGKYGITQKIVSAFIYFLFRYLSTDKKGGDQFCGLFVRNESNKLNQ